MLVSCGRRLGVRGRHPRVPPPARGVRVVQRDVADLEGAHSPARLSQRQLLPVDDLRGIRLPRPLQGQTRVDRQLVADGASPHPRPPRPRSRPGPLPERGATAALSAASRDTGHSQRARTGRLAATAGKIARENPQRGAHQNDRRGEHERVEALAPERPQHDPDDQAGGDGEDRVPSGRILAKPARAWPGAVHTPVPGPPHRSRPAASPRRGPHPPHPPAPPGPRLAAARTSRVPTITPSAPASAASAPARGCRSRSRSPPARSCSPSREPAPRRMLPQRFALTGRAHDRDRVQETPRARRDRRQALGGRRGCDQWHQRQAVSVTRLEHLGRLPERQIGHDQPARPGLLQPLVRTPRPPQPAPCSRSTSAPPERSAPVRVPPPAHPSCSPPRQAHASPPRGSPDRRRADRSKGHRARSHLRPPQRMPGRSSPTRAGWENLP